MKRLLIIGFGLFVALSVYGYQAKMDVAINGREIKVQCSYTFSNNAVRIELPKRAKLISLSTPSKANVAYFNNENSLRIENVVIDYNGKLNLVYTLPLADPEFYKEDWLSMPDEKGVVSATVSVPNGYKGLFIPYDSKNTEGYELSPEEKPILICGKFQGVDDSFNGRKYELFYQFKLNTSVKDIDALTKYYEGVLGPLDRKNLVLVTLPAIQNRIYFSKNFIFLAINNTLPDEIKRALVQMWFKPKSNLNEETIFAFSDYFRRVVEDSGLKKSDDAVVVPVPAYSYYETVLKKGFPSSGEVLCDVNSMLRNFALLNLAYYNLGQERFQNGIRNYLKDADGKTGFNSAFQSVTSNTNTDGAISFICDTLLPVAKMVPDLNVKGQFVYRSMENIPNIVVNINGEKRPVIWGSRRGVDLGNISGSVYLDPWNEIPQLNYYNDKTFTDPKEEAEWNAAAQVAGVHKHYRDESFRDILNMDKFKAPGGGAFDLAKDATVYIAIVKFIAPVNNKLSTGLKEVVITVTNGKPVVVADRVRL